MDHPVLTPRQIETMQHAAAGRKYREIARVMQISPRTVSEYWKDIYIRLHAHSRAEAVVKAIRMGLLSALMCLGLFAQDPTPDQLSAVMTPEAKAALWDLALNPQGVLVYYLGTVAPLDWGTTAMRPWPPMLPAIDASKRYLILPLGVKLPVVRGLSPMVGPAGAAGAQQFTGPWFPKMGVPKY